MRYSIPWIGKSHAPREQTLESIHYLSLIAQPAFTAGSTNHDHHVLMWITTCVSSLSHDSAVHDC